MPSMTKPTESKVPAAFQAMLAFLQMMTRGFFSHSGEQPAVIGVQAVDAITSYYREHPRLIALRDLVQAAADEHAGSGAPAAPSPAWLRGEALHPDVVAAAPSASHIGVDPGLRGSGRTVTQVREPAFDRLDAAVDVLRDTSPGWARTVIEAFDAYAASRATMTGTASTAETLTFTRLEGETPEAFRARIALHLNGMGSARYVLPGQDGTREALGAIVRGVWIKWAKEQPSPKPSWLVPWEGLSEPDKEVDRRIGVALATVGQSIAGAIDAPVLTEEAAQKWAEGMCGAADLAAPADAVTEALLAASRGEYPTT